MIRIATLVVSLLAACSAAPTSPGPEEAPTIPAAFLGVWDSSEGCTQTYSESRINISQTRLRFWESTGDIEQIEIKQPTKIVLSLNMNGEGETWSTTMELELLATGDLVGSSDDGGLGIWSRCPAKPR